MKIFENYKAVDINRTDRQTDKWLKMFLLDSEGLKTCITDENLNLNFRCHSYNKNLYNKKINHQRRIENHFFLRRASWLNGFTHYLIFAGYWSCELKMFIQCIFIFREFLLLQNSTHELKYLKKKNINVTLGIADLFWYNPARNWDLRFLSSDLNENR